jgi:hypothetical protein
MFVGPIEVDGFDRAFAYVGSMSLEFCIPYMATRVFLTQTGQAVALARVLCIVIATVGTLGILDEVSGRFLVRETVRSITGYCKIVASDNVDLTRGFLFRATSTLDHPILFGTTCMFSLLMATAMRGALRRFMLAGSATVLVLSVSSALIGGTVVGFGALLYDRIMRHFRFCWRLALGSAAVFLIIIFTAHPHPWGFIFNRLTFNSQTAYYRLLQWEFVGPLVMNSPILGIGITDAWLTDSDLANTIDAHWLAMTMNFGIPGSILIFLSLVTSCSLSIDIGNKSLNLTGQERQLGFILSLILGIVIVVGFMVTYFGIVYLLIMFLAGIRAHLGSLGAMQREPGLHDDGLRNCL